MDSNSSTEETFLKFLYNHRLKLPDEAQKAVPGIYCQPDFYYAPDTWIFCDGSPHDKLEVQEKDAEQRKAILDRGDEVITFYYQNSMEDLVARYPEIFKKIS